MEDQDAGGLLEKYLSKFERTVDLDHRQEAEALCRKVFELEPVDELPFIARDQSQAADQDWPRFPYNEAFFDPAKMLLNELRVAFIHDQLKDCHPLNVRCNYGTPILPSVFGATYQLMESSKPWPHAVGGRDDIRELIDRGIPDCRNSLGGRCFDTAQFYQDVLSDYPQLEQAISIYHPDVQGPFDVAHVLWGPDIFFAMYDCPEQVHELLGLVTTTYAGWMREWKRFIGEGNDFTTHWCLYIRGGIMLRDDTPVTMSAEHYEEFVKPYDQILLDEFGGCIHFCGKGDQFVASMCQSRNLYGINCSQPELNSVDLLVESAVENGIVLLYLPKRCVPANMNTGAIVRQ